MGAAPLLLAMVLMVADAGWQSDGQGGYEYIVQVPPEQWESVKREGSITSRIPDHLRGRVSSVRIQIADGPLPRQDLVASDTVRAAYPGPPDTLETARAQGGSGFQMPPDLQQLGQATEKAVQDARDAGATQLGNAARQAGQRMGDALEQSIASNQNPAGGGRVGFGGFAPGSNAGAGPNTSAPNTSTPNTSAPNTSASNNSANPGVANPAASGPSTSAGSVAANGGTNAYGASNFSGFSGSSSSGSAGNSGGGSSNPASPPAGSASNFNYANQPTGQSNSAAGGPTTSRPAAPTGIPAIDNSSSPWSGSSAQGTAGGSRDGALSYSGSTAYPSAATQADPPSVTQTGTQNYAANNNTASLRNGTLETRLRAEEARFQFDAANDLIVNESVLYVVGISDQVDIDATGRLYDKATSKWLRDNDPRYLDVISFVNSYNAQRKERLASLGGVSGLQPPRQQTTGGGIGFGNYGTNGGTTDPRTSGGVGNGSIGFGGSNQTTTTPTPTDYALDLRDRIELETLRLASKNAATTNAMTPPTNAAPPTTTRDKSPSDDPLSTTTPPRGKQPTELQSQPFFNFLLLLSMIGNLYCGIAISRLIKRYRNLVASHRGNTLAT
jgi:hypothetical protein